MKIVVENFLKSGSAKKQPNKNKTMQQKLIYFFMLKIFCILLEGITFFWQTMDLFEVTFCHFGLNN